MLGDDDAPGCSRDSAALLRLQEAVLACCTTSTTSSARRARDFNYAKRTESADLRGRVALLTGGRVKIGYQAGIKLLRAGATLIVTTRFPRDAALRYAREPDFDDVVRSARDLRPRPAVHPERRSLLPSPRRHA